MSKFKVGDLVYITLAGQDFLSRNRDAQSNVQVNGRMAKILEIYDWKTARGRKILADRKKSHFTWSKLKSKDFKFVLCIYGPELKHPDTGSMGVMVPEIFTEFHPTAEGKIKLFDKWNDDMFLDMFAQNEDYKVTKQVTKKAVKKPPKRRAAKKAVKKKAKES